MENEPTTDNTAIQENPSQDQPVQPEPQSGVVDLTGGAENGAVEKDLLPDLIEHREKIVHEFDENGNVTGFHKESVTEGE